MCTRCAKQNWKNWIRLVVLEVRILRLEGEWTLESIKVQCQQPLKHTIDFPAWSVSMQHLDSRYYFIDFYRFCSRKTKQLHPLSSINHHLHRLSTVDTFCSTWHEGHLMHPPRHLFRAPPVLWQDVTNGGKHRHLWGRWAKGKFRINFWCSSQDFIEKWSLL